MQTKVSGMYSKLALQRTTDECSGEKRLLEKEHPRLGFSANDNTAHHLFWRQCMGLDRVAVLCHKTRHEAVIYVVADLAKM